MKVYIVTTESYVMSNGSTSTVEVFDTVEKAKVEYANMIAAFKKDLPNLNDYTLDDFGTSFEGYLKGAYAEDHFVISLFEREVL